MAKQLLIFLQIKNQCLILWLVKALHLFTNLKVKQLNIYQILLKDKLKPSKIILVIIQKVKTKKKENKKLKNQKAFKIKLLMVYQKNLIMNLIFNFTVKILDLLKELNLLVLKYPLLIKNMLLILKTFYLKMLVKEMQDFSLRKSMKMNLFMFLIKALMKKILFFIYY